MTDQISLTGNDATITNPCPTPWKMSWATRANARSVLHAKAAQKGGQLRPYHCVCGNWHVTSMTRKAAKAVKRRKRLA